MMKIAIVGGGISGLASAYFLTGRAHVTLYEALPELGGHANTHTAIFDGKHIPVDTGFMVYNPEMYPNFVKLIDKLGIETTETKMTYSAQIPNQIVYSSSFPVGIFADYKNVFNLKYIKFLFEIIKFRIVARNDLAKKAIDQNQTLGDYLKKYNFSDNLYNWFLVPLLSAIWSCPDISKIKEFPAYSTMVFFNNHKLLNHNQPVWRTIKNGSMEYVSRLASYLCETGVVIKKNCTVDSVKRATDGVEVHTDRGVESYDYVIFATHADVTKSILTDANADEKTALECFSYSKNTTVLHSEEKLMPENKNAWASWNYAIHSDSLASDKVTFTYNMNILQDIPKKYPVFVTLNSPVEINKSKVHGVFEYSHPVYNLQSLRGQQLLQNLQAKNRVLFTGAHLGFGFHEDGIVSALTAVKHLGISDPWQDGRSIL